MIIDGKKLAFEIVAGLKNEFAKLPSKAVLAALTAGDNLTCEIFLRQKQKTSQELGVEMRIIKVSGNEEDLMAAIESLNQNSEVRGIIVQLPLPGGFEFEKIAKTIAPSKDVDGFSGASVNPPAVETVAYLFKKFNVVWQDKKIAVVGKGKLVGEPVFQWLAKNKREGMDIFVIDHKTSKEKKEEWLKQADIVISGVGKANLITREKVKEGVAAIDFGYDIQEGKIYGDISQEVAEQSVLFTPTPGGTGPILVAMLFRNLLKLTQK